MSLPKSQKIKQHQGYAAAMKGGSVNKIDGFKIYTTPNDKLQIGVVIPKRMIALSSDRQRLRRQIHGIAQTMPLGKIMLIVQVTKKWKDPIELSTLKEVMLKFSKPSTNPAGLNFQP